MRPYQCVGQQQGVHYIAVPTVYDVTPPVNLSAPPLPICEMRHLFAFGEGSEIRGGSVLSSLVSTSVSG